MESVIEKTDTKEYTIRKITKNDVYGVLDLIMQFRKEVLDKTMVSFDTPTLTKRIAESIHKDIPCIRVAVDDEKVIGLIAYLVLNSYFDENQIMALELMWFVNKDYRGAKVGKLLLKAAEKDAKLKGAETLTMIAGHYSVNTGKDRALDIFYRRRGYKKLESHYIKNLGG